MGDETATDINSVTIHLFTHSVMSACFTSTFWFWPGSSGSCKKRKTKDAMKLIKTNRKGVWKELRKLQKKEQQKVKNKLSMLSFKSVVGEDGS